MNNVTKIKIVKSASEVFEALADPAQMSNYWFSSGSGRLEPGKTITWRYDEYNAQVDIKVMQTEINKKIVFQWGTDGEGHVVTITLQELEQASTIIEVNEEGFNETDEDFIRQLVDNKEGWVYVLTCLKGYLEFGISNLRAAIVR
ncbi:SRPBCC family protein [Paenibacillus sp. GCM10027628]|uniref:SRPBCC family protein n=1 Tax=Paenibacillus sp. GCM10027628 TaxID=3273413 RepID=UPI003634EFBF